MKLVILIKSKNLNKNINFLIIIKMLENIRSKYIVKLILNNIDGKRKLIIVKYNKSIKLNLDIKFFDYMAYCGKYIKYISESKVEEYDFEDNLLFEGEYKDGKRNGIGKEYNIYKELSFEGEYLNGKRNGKGKEYYYKGEIKFSGEYLDGKRWNGIMYNKINGKNYTGVLGKGKGFLEDFDFFGDKIFEGQFINGERNGQGKEYKLHNIIFAGEYKNGKRHGMGKNFFKDGKVIFNGLYKEGKKWGGIGYDKNNKIICEFKNGNGFIKEYNGCAGAITFEGEFINGEGNGKAKEYNFYGKLIYEGEYLNGKRNGKGKEYNEGKEIIFVGEYLNGKRLKGKLFREGKIEFKGVFLGGKKWHGLGYDYEGNVIYELSNGKGKIREYNKRGKLIFEGEYLNGKRHGKGKEYDNHGKVYEVEYNDGKNIKKYLTENGKIII